MNRFYSFIIPVFNRPDELAELLGSLAAQILKSFEAVIVEDGSTIRSDEVIVKFSSLFPIHYFDRPKSGPSRARNFGISRAKGDYLIFVDSDCILPPGYLACIDEFLDKSPLDFFGGPDRAAPVFNSTQKAISYAMTSFLTTGGIRGGKKKVDRFYPRSFNMGVTRDACLSVGGFPVTRMHPGEDMVFSIELIKRGFRSGLIPSAFVYHKRRTTLGRFYRQVYGFGKTRYIISRVYPETFMIFYLFPALFVAACLILPLAAILIATTANNLWGLLALSPMVAWVLMVLADASIRNRSWRIGLKSLVASFIQLTGYGIGFTGAFYRAKVRGIDEYGVFSKGFYPEDSQNLQ
jgi:glycosyltransferase involved in cell wall biosynthesis